MLKLDHLTIVAPTLETGAEYVRSRLGIVMPTGGEHPQMGTHNLLLRLGDDVFLEVIATNLKATRPNRPRWFGLDDAKFIESAWTEGRRLLGWVARTDDLEAVLTSQRKILGQKIRISRGDRAWFFSVLADGSLPAGGVAPSVIEWSDGGNPASEMPDYGVSLLSFELEHPDPEWVSALYANLGVVNPPKVRRGRKFSYRAFIKTANGTKELR
jgi:hypothetical protein